MKIYILIIFLLAAFQGFSQKKKKKEDPRDMKIDSLTKANDMLSVQIDSISKDRTLYYGLYTTIKEKVLLADFDPAKLPQIIDSIRVSRDSTTSTLSAPIAPLRDSLSMLRKENNMLKAKLDTLAASSVAVDKTKLMAELKDLKSLLDAKVITQAEYDTKKKLVMDKWQ